MYVSCDVNKSIHYFTLSANQNNSDAQLYLALIYMINEPFKNITKSLKYLQYSAENECRIAQQILGDLYFEGYLLPYNIEKTIHFYKEVSCFNNRYAKNNLGVIYKKGISGTVTNISLAKEYFEEAIKQKRDILSMFNLANLLLDEEPEIIDYNKIYYLLIESSLGGLDLSMYLLCFILIQKYESINYKIIENKLKENGFESNELVSLLYQICEIIQKKDKETCKEIYKQIRETDLIYITFQIISLEEVEKFREMHKLNQKPKPKDINKEFYEGFGIDI